MSITVEIIRQTIYEITQHYFSYAKARRRFYTLHNENAIKQDSMGAVSRKDLQAKLEMNDAALQQDMLVLSVRDEIQDSKLVQQALARGMSVVATMMAQSAIQLVKVNRQMLLETQAVLATLSVGIVFSRAFPTICSYCAHSFSGASRKAEDLQRWQECFGKKAQKQMKFRGLGCKQCDNTGFGEELVCSEVVLLDKIAWHCIEKQDWLAWENHLTKQGWLSYDAQVLDWIRKGRCDPGDIENYVGELFLALQQDSVNYHSFATTRIK